MSFKYDAAYDSHFFNVGENQDKLEIEKYVIDSGKAYYRFCPAVEHTALDEDDIALIICEFIADSERVAQKVSLMLGAVMLGNGGDTDDSCII